MLHPVRASGDAALVAPTRSVAEVIARLLAAGLVLTALALLAAGALGSEHMRTTIVERGPSCILRMTTGIQCPFCGMTRATLALGGGDFHRAFALHPLAPFALAFALFTLGVVAVGKTRALLVGHRPMMLFSTIAVIWIVRLAA